MNRDQWDFRSKKKVVFVGTAGSGKTEVSINYALAWSKQSEDRIFMVDMDMIKPMFRLRSVKNKLKNESIELLLPPEPYGYADFPVISQGADSHIRHPDMSIVVDVGGDEEGARMIGRYSGAFKSSVSDFLYVYNANRPDATDMAQLFKSINKIQKSGRFSFTGVIHNSHLMNETTVETLESNMENAYKVSSMLNLPIIFHSIREDLFPEALKKIKEPLFPLKLFMEPVWI